ncbi:hypothetical protein HOG17_05515 [Candidatus Peregrinibacteria bacterium]|jgi:hypothetical protein|nr:hypothetical protein [Candidatus Peregrinibacteria bacterium]MBT4148139.1 hypothetical protein [Candidatus Peregrinibacteria bacterium]MBT4366626.1 hypothetical protein [Candidatus Peregrinibacteria bacterium]MBT4455613.1 hypothetical protein [Candidatus Peregrinibacteria bacterium]
MNIRKLLTPVLAVFLLLTFAVSVAYAGWSTWDYLQKQKFQTCWKADCYQLLLDKNWSEYMQCSQGCASEADNYDSTCSTCEDSDNGLDYYNFGTVVTDTKPGGVDDYCYTFSNGKTYLMEGTCKNGKYIRHQKNCKELGMKYDCLEGACVYFNNAPEFQGGIDGTDYEIDVGNGNNDLTINVGATDADGDDLTFYAENLPEGASFENGTPPGGPFPEDVQYGIFEWNPQSGQAGEYEITLFVTDGEATMTVDITVDVTEDVEEDVCPVYVSLDPSNGNTILNGWNDLLDFTIQSECETVIESIGFEFIGSYMKKDEGKLWHVDSSTYLTGIGGGVGDTSISEYYGSQDVILFPGVDNEFTLKGLFNGLTLLDNDVIQVELFSLILKDLDTGEYIIWEEGDTYVEIIHALSY